MRAVLLALVAAAIALPAGAARGAVLDPNRDDHAFAVSLGAGYAFADAPEGEPAAHRIAAQAGVRYVLYGFWEFAIDLRVDADPAVSPAGNPSSLLGLAWAIGNIDVSPLSPFVGLGGGVELDPHALGAVTATAGALAGLALWFERTWRLSLRLTQRVTFGSAGWTLPLDVVLTTEYFF
jgi:hypothetical protein